MAKKKRKGHQHTKSSSALQHTDKETLAKDAQKALEQERFRDAIAHYKTLLKQEETTQARRGLADAYEGRATALSDKGMNKEALAIWENRQALGNDVAPLRLSYVDVLLRVGKAADVAALLHADNNMLSNAEWDQLRARLAAYSLAGNTHIRDVLPASDPLHGHLDAAEMALDAYLRGDDDTLKKSLSNIPFRSPCRDFAHILKALLSVSKKPEDAKARLSRVPNDSAFFTLKHAVELVCLPDKTLLTQLNNVGESTRRFVLTLRGWDANRQAMQQTLQKLGPKPSDKTLFKLMHRYSQTFGKAWVEEYGLRLLVAHFPDSLEWWRQERPEPPPDYDTYRLVTWFLVDYNADPRELLDSLDTLTEIILEEGKAEPGSDRAIQIALILRYIDKRYCLLDGEPSKYADSLDRYAAERVEESLSYDPDDLEPYLRLHAYFLRGKYLKQARYYQDQALSRWPNDIRVLTAALDTALASQSFKKAAKFAHQILSVDPINRPVRERLVKAHLAHASKQLKAGRPDLAEKELSEATQWDTQARFAQRQEVIAALIEIQRDVNTGKERLVKAYQRQGEGLSAYFNIASELLNVGVAPSQIAQRFGIKKPQVQGTLDMEAFSSQLQTQLADGKLSGDLKRYFDMPLNTAAILPLTFDARVQYCELFKRCDWQVPRLAFACHGVRQYEAPIFELHAFEAKYPQKSFLATEQEIHRLEVAEKRAIEASDLHTATRLSDILSRFRFLEMVPPSSD